MKYFRASAITTASLIALITTPSYAGPLSGQLAQTFQSIINGAGQSCPQATYAKPLGTSSNGDTIVVISCSDGAQHVVRILPDDRVAYIADCTVWQSTTGMSC